jgi:hypothetical protein
MVEAERGGEGVEEEEFGVGGIVAKPIAHNWNPWIIWSRSRFAPLQQTARTTPSPRGDLDVSLSWVPGRANHYGDRMG